MKHYGKKGNYSTCLGEGPSEKQGHSVKIKEDEAEIMHNKVDGYRILLVRMDI